MEIPSSTSQVKHTVEILPESHCALVVTEVRNAEGELVRTQGSRLPIISLLELADLEDSPPAA